MKASIPHCFARVMSGDPPIHPLFNGTLCERSQSRQTNQNIDIARPAAVLSKSEKVSSTFPFSFQF